MLSSWLPRILLILGIFSAGAIRFYHPGWDANLIDNGREQVHQQHPDERHIFGVVHRIQPKAGLWDPDFFAYGSFPVYLLKLSSIYLTEDHPGVMPWLESKSTHLGLTLAGLGLLCGAWIWRRRRAKPRSRRPSRLRLAGETLGLFLAGLVIFRIAALLPAPSWFSEFRPGNHIYIYFARWISGAAGLGCVILTYVLGKRMFGWKVGIAAAVALGLSPLHVQLSHYFTFDIIMSFFVLLTAYYAHRILIGGSWKDDLLSGFFLGMALGSKFSALPAAALIVGAHMLRALYSSRTRGSARVKRSGPKWEMFLKGMEWPGLYLAGVTAVLVFRLVEPYAFVVSGSGIQPKFSALVLPFMVLALFGLSVHFWIKTHPKKYKKGIWTSLSRVGVAVAFFVLAAFGLTTLFNRPLLFAPKLLANLNEQGRMVRGISLPVYVYQFRNTVPFLYHAKQLLFWGMGPGLGLIALAGLFWSTFRQGWLFVKDVTSQFAGKILARADVFVLLLLAFALPYILITGSFYVKFLRYMVPVYPFLLLLGFRWVIPRIEALRGVYSKLAWGSLGAFFLIALIQIIAFLGIYDQELTRIRASRWIYENVPPGSTIAHEHWDDRLPFPIAGLSGQGRAKTLELRIYDMERPGMFEQVTGALSKADYVVLSSKKLYGTLIRFDEEHPDIFLYKVRRGEGHGLYWDGSKIPIPQRPKTASYYQNLFAGNLGYRLVHQEITVPHIWGLEFDDLKVEETFTVYDHQRVFIFENVHKLSSIEIRRRIMKHKVQTDPWDLIRHPSTIAHKEVRSNREALAPRTPRVPVAAVVSAQRLEPATNPNIGRLLKPGIRLPNFAAPFVWLLGTNVLALILLPYMAGIGRRLPDRGWAASKGLGILVLAWVSWLAPSLSPWPFSQAGIAGLALLLAGGALWIQKKNVWPDIRDFRKAKKIIFFEEGLFVAVFLGFLLLRSFMPDIHNLVGHGYRGGGEPLGITYLSGVMRCVTFPAYDPWLAGITSNYYHWGYVILATLAKLFGTSSAVAYNLALPLLLALLCLFSFSSVHALTGSRVFAGLAAFLAAFCANLWAFLYVVINWFSGGWAKVKGLFQGIHYIWNPTRLDGVPLPGRESWSSSIFEFPYFSYLYGDLHPHNIAIPFLALLLVLVSARALKPRGKPRAGPALETWLFAFFLALTLGMTFPTNTWNFPISLFCLMAGLIVLPLAKQTFAKRLVEMGAILLVSGLMFLPFYSHFEKGGTGVRLLPPGDANLPASALWALFGIFFVFLTPPALSGIGSVLATLRRVPRKQEKKGRRRRARPSLFTGLSWPGIAWLGIGLFWAFALMSVFGVPGIGREMHIAAADSDRALKLLALAALGFLSAGVPWSHLGSLVSRFALPSKNRTRKRKVLPKRSLRLEALLMSPAKNIPLLLIGSSVGFLLGGEGVLATISIYLAGMCRLLLASKEPVQRVSLTWILGGLFIMAGTEFVFIADRVNTMFKFYFQAWILLALGSAVPLWALIPKLSRREHKRMMRWIPAWALASLGVLALGGMATRGYVSTPWSAVILGFAIAGMLISLRPGPMALAYRIVSLFPLGLAVVLGILRGRGYSVEPASPAIFVPLLACLAVGTSLWFLKKKGGLAAAPYLGLALALFIAVGKYPILASISKVWMTQQNDAEGMSRSRLDGFRYLETLPLRTRGGSMHAEDYGAIQYLLNNADRIGLVLEAPGYEMYQGYSRISIFTGLPTLLGWRYQVGQQRAGNRPAQNLMTRMSAMATKIYNTGDRSEAALLLKEAKVAYVYVGRIERNRYGAGGLAKFENWLDVAGRWGESVLYKVDLSDG